MNSMAIGVRDNLQCDTIGFISCIVHALASLYYSDKLYQVLFCDSRNLIGLK